MLVWRDFKDVGWKGECVDGTLLVWRDLKDGNKMLLFQRDLKGVSQEREHTDEDEMLLINNVLSICSPS